MSDFRLDGEFGYNSVDDMIDSWEQTVLEEQKSNQTEVPSEAPSES